MKMTDVKLEAEVVMRLVEEQMIFILEIDIIPVEFLVCTKIILFLYIYTTLSLYIVRI